MVSASDRHMYQPGLMYVAFGQMMPDELYRDQASLLESSIDFHVDPAEKFDLDNNRVTTASGQVHDYDILVIATGSRIMPKNTPGLKEGAETFYTEEGAIKMFRALRQFQGGKVAIVVGVPHKCPIAPVEVTFSLHDYFKSRGIRDKVEIKYHYPINRIHSIENVAAWAEPEFQRMGVEYETLFNVDEVDAENRIVKSLEGSEYQYDLLISIPEHTGAEAIIDNDLGPDGWIPTDRHQLTMSGHDNVYVVGDTTDLPVQQDGIGGSLSGRGHRGEHRLEDQDRHTGRRIRRQGVLLHRSRLRQGNLRDVQLRLSSRSEITEQVDALVQGQLQQDVLVQCSRATVRQTTMTSGPEGENNDSLERSLEGLAEIGTVIAAAKDAVNDDMVARMASAISEGITLLDRLTRNQALVRLLQNLDRPENQALLRSLSEALSKTSREMSTSAPAKGGLGNLLRQLNDPGTQEGLRMLAILGKHLGEGIRK